MNRRAFILAGVGQPYFRDLMMDGANMTESETKLARSAMWQKTTDGLSLEQVELHRRGNAFCISGMMLGVHAGGRMRACTA